ncbi:MAG: STAS domain-containing protein [Candidatus Anammoxibacter sp.]
MRLVCDTQNDNIGLIELISDYGGSCARELQDYLNTCLDHTRRFQLINLKQTSCLDSHYVRVLCDFIERGGDIRLFNTNKEIKRILKIEKKDKVIKVYDETDADNTISMFTKELSAKEDTNQDSLQARQYIRVSTNFPAEFNYHSDHYGVLYVRVKVLNLSQCGMLVNYVTVTSREEDSSNFHFSTKHELNDIKFQLEKETDYIKSDGLCVWDAGRDKGLFAGVLFKELGNNHKVMIKEFVSNHGG